MADGRRDPPPMQTNDVRTVTVGTIAWVVFLIVLIPLRSRLEREGLLWWYPMALCGIGLGLLGLWGTRRRRAHGLDRVSAGEDMRSNPPA